MNKTATDSIRRVMSLLRLADQTRESFQALSRNVLYKQHLQELRINSLALIDELYRENHHVYRNFEKLVAEKPSLKQIDSITNLLRSALEDLEEYERLPVVHTNSLLEHARQALQKGNQAFAIVTAGNALEERLVQLCAAHDIELRSSDAGFVGPEQRNMALMRKGLYNRVKQKQVSAWIGLRNSAAHGRNDDYTLTDVDRRLADVSLFLVELPLPSSTPAALHTLSAPADEHWPKPSRRRPKPYGRKGVFVWLPTRFAAFQAVVSQQKRALALPRRSRQKIWVRTRRRPRLFC